VFVRTLSGKTITINVNDFTSERILSIKEKISKKESIPMAALNNFRLIFEGKNLLETGLTTQDYNIGQESTIHMVQRIVGGAQEWDPSLLALAKKHRVNKKICRGCYCRLPIRAKNCRKKKCRVGGNKLRFKKKLDKYGK
jgi:ribosomal protein L40E